MARNTEATKPIEAPALRHTAQYVIKWVNLNGCKESRVYEDYSRMQGFVDALKAVHNAYDSILYASIISVERVMITTENITKELI